MNQDKIFLQDILPLDILKNEGTVLIIRHFHKNLSEMIRKHFIEEYQSYQHQRAFRNCKYIISFLGGEHNSGIFYGIFENTGIIENDKLPPYPITLMHLTDPPIPEKSFYLNLRRLTQFDKYSNRLIINWMAPRGWFHTYGKVKNKEVIKILPFNYVKNFPGLMNIRIDFDELKKIINNPGSHEDWYNSLTRLQAVYMILDKNTGNQYVGTTYGKNGLWQRWETYIKGDKTGNNVKLTELKEKNPEFYKNFQYSILEVLSKTATENECTRIESIWKDKLGSRAFGLNDN
jgi:hypothetical protein